jgi:hypothetical protein
MCEMNEWMTKGERVDVFNPNTAVVFSSVGTSFTRKKEI